MSADDAGEASLTLADLKNRMDALYARTERQGEQIDELETELEEERAHRKALEQELEGLEQYIEEVDGRTSLLDLVDSADDLTGRQRSVALLQSCQRELDASADATVLRVGKEDAEKRLQHPGDVDRTAIYKDMSRAAGWLPDEIATYDDGVLTVDVSEGSLTAVIESRKPEGGR